MLILSKKKNKQKETAAPSHLLSLAGGHSKELWAYRTPEENEDVAVPCSLGPNGLSQEESEDTCLTCHSRWWLVGGQG